MFSLCYDDVGKEVSQKVREVLLGNSLDVLKQFDENMFDSVVTDPPYELAFMGRSWDASGISYRPEMWAEVLRVLKPGGHLLAFGGTRTYHRMTCAIEDAGFEIRGCLFWIFGNGFPKSTDVSKAIDKYLGAEREDPNTPVTDEAKKWKGWGTALKPACEPIVMARKPFNRTVAENVLEWGTGGINIDATRIPSGPDHLSKCQSVIGLDSNRNGACYGQWSGPRTNSYHPGGRWPSNVFLDEVAAQMLDEQSGISRSRQGKPRSGKSGKGWGMQHTGAEYLDSGGASRFFYVAKATTKERTHNGQVKNNHPTVKPLKLMEQLIKLVTPTGGIVLDPFCGSGSTLVAAKMLGFDYVGIDMEPEYVDLTRRRLELTHPSILARC